MATNSIPLTLESPGTIRYTAEMALAGRRLNACALSLKYQYNRAAFAADLDGFLRRAQLDARERALVVERDWTALLHAGCHLQALLFFAAASGETLWHIGSHNAGIEVSEMMKLCPRRVTGLPPSLSRARTDG